MISKKFVTAAEEVEKVLEAIHACIDCIENEYSVVDMERDQLYEENTRLRERISNLETLVKELRGL